MGGSKYKRKTLVKGSTSEDSPKIPQLQRPKQTHKKKTKSSKKGSKKKNKREAI